MIMMIQMMMIVLKFGKSTFHRWHSSAFQVYIDTPREVRARLAEELAAKVAGSMQLG